MTSVTFQLGELPAIQRLEAEKQRVTDERLRSTVAAECSYQKKTEEEAAGRWVEHTHLRLGECVRY